MLNIYMGKENIPKDKEFVYDVEAFWSQVGIPDNRGSRYILNNFEYVEY